MVITVLHIFFFFVILVELYYIKYAVCRREQRRGIKYVTKKPVLKIVRKIEDRKETKLNDTR